MSSPKYHPGDSGDAGATPHLPLSEDNGFDSEEQSIGALVMDATQHVSTLVRAEVELIKAESVGEAKKLLKGSVFFIIAAVVGLYSSFFFFFFLGELLSEWLPSWAAYAIVFGMMLVTTALFAILGRRKWKKLQAPQRSLDSLRETAATLQPRRDRNSAATEVPRVPTGVDPEVTRH